MQRALKGRRSHLLFEDREGNIWFKASPGLPGEEFTYRLNPVTGIIKRYPLLDINGLNGFSRYFKNFGTVESSDAVWLLDAKKNLRNWNRQKDSFEIIIPAGKDLSSSGITDTIKQMGKGSGNRLLLTGTHGIYIFDSKDQKIVKSYIHAAADPNSLPDSLGLCFEDLSGQIWVNHRRGKISLIDPASGNIQTFTYGSEQYPFPTGYERSPVLFLNSTKQRRHLVPGMGRWE